MALNYEDEEKEFINDEPGSQVIKDLQDPEEVDAAIELLKEKYDTPEKETVRGLEPEPKGEDTSKEPKDKTESESKEAEIPKQGKPETTKSEESKKETDDLKDAGTKFVLNDEVIAKQPEEYKEILTKYKGKGKEDLAKAAANAVIMKNPYLKDNPKTLLAITETFAELPENELLKTLIDTQANVGVISKPLSGNTEKSSNIPNVTSSKIELPKLPEDDEQVKAILSQETVKRLKRMGYKDIPDDMDSEDYLEWERDLQDNGGLRKVEKFLSDLKEASSSVKNELQKVVYAQTNLQNLYVSSPAEIVDILTDENLPLLKRYNDNYIVENNKTLESEVSLIKKELEKLGVDLSELGIDLNLEKDNSGAYFNEYLNQLMQEGSGIDRNVISIVGRVPVLKKSQLVKKFLYENNPKILTSIVNKQAKSAKFETEKLKSESLNALGASKSGGSKLPIESVNSITDIYDDDQLNKVTESIFNKY